MLPRPAYLTMCRSIQLLAQLAPGDAAKDLEILVLRHQPSQDCARQRGARTDGLAGLDAAEGGRRWVMTLRSGVGRTARRALLH